MRKLSLFLPLLYLAAGAAFAQDDAPPLTGTLKAGEVSLTRVNGKVSAGTLGTFEFTQDGFAAAFTATDLSKVVRTTDPAPTTIIGNCNFQAFVQRDPVAPTTGATTYLDAGTAINLTGPKGTKQIPVFQTPANVKFLFGAMLGGGPSFPGLPTPPPLYLEPGTYTADNGSGGADVGPFTATLELPTPFMWTNTDAAATIDRAAGVDITWTGGDPNTKVFIGGSVRVTDPATRKEIGGGVFTCTEDNSAGHFFVPPEVLTLLPASTTTAGVSNGSMIVTNGVVAKFDLAGFDLAQFVFSVGIARSPQFN